MGLNAGSQPFANLLHLALVFLTSHLPFRLLVGTAMAVAALHVHAVEVSFGPGLPTIHYSD